MGVIAAFPLVGEPAIGPDLRRAQGQLAGPEDDAEWFVVEYERQTGHRYSSALQDVMLQGQGSCHWGLLQRGVVERVTGGSGVGGYSDTFARVSA